MNEYNKITALYSRLSVGDEDRDGGESNSIVNQKAFLERYAQQQRLTNIRHYIDDDESGRFFDRSAYSRMMEDVENGKIGVCIRLHQNYLRRKANGKQKEWEERYNAKRKAKMEAAKAAIRAEDMEKGIFIPVSQLPRQEPHKATVSASAAI